MGKVIDRINALKIKLLDSYPPVGVYVATKIIGAIKTTMGKKRYLSWLIFSIEIL